ncbi:MAG: hypothetical protein RMN51_09860 [Verrucomicrobiota bacterium]|nr:hypothetical protein [Limisphaera sp.]MDW8382394.1 hypothetical protein [Verrucomicrobiota bacterium]
MNTQQIKHGTDGGLSHSLVGLRWGACIQSGLLGGGLLTRYERTHAGVSEPTSMQKRRPRDHFAPERNWMNDPNSWVWFEGEYPLGSITCFTNTVHMGIVGDT